MNPELKNVNILTFATAKGVVTQILPDNEMPIVPDGRHVDLCLNPMSVISRMNMGQLYEVHVGNVLDTARRWLDKNKNDTDKCVKMLCQLYTLLDGYEDKRLSNSMIANLTNMPRQQQIDVIEQYVSKGIHMVFPPFQSPKLESIQKAADLVGAELESILYLPKYGRKSMYPITWGTLYILKLEHISAIKQNTRTIGKNNIVTSLPAKPGHHSNSIRVGEQDSWAITVYPHGKEFLKEMFLVNSDNPKIKTDIIRQIEETGGSDIDYSKYSESDLRSGSSRALECFGRVAGLAIK